MSLGSRKGIIDSQEKGPVVPTNPTFKMPLSSNLTTYTTSDSSIVTITLGGSIAMAGSGTTINGVSVPNTSRNSGTNRQYLKLQGDIFKIGANEDFTLSFWLKKDDYNNTYNIWSSGDSNPSNYEIQLYTVGGDRGRFYDLQNYSDFSNAILNNWSFHCIVRYRAGNSIRYYVNGVLQTSLSYLATKKVFDQGIIYLPDWPNMWGNWQTAILKCNLADVYFKKGVSEDGTIIVNPYR